MCKMYVIGFLWLCDFTYIMQVDVYRCSIEECDISMTCPSKFACCLNMSHCDLAALYSSVIKIDDTIHLTSERNDSKNRT